MLVVERQNNIIERVRIEGSVPVEKLAEELKVSPMTIRRDLIKLQDEGKIDRCHGGAVAKQEVNYADKQTDHLEDKRKLAKKCAEFVSEGDVIYLDAGTTMYEIACCIKEIQDIMVVTNDLEIAGYLKESTVELILCGGYVQKSTGSMYGYYATQMIENFRFNIGFFGAASINEEFQVQTPTIEKAFLKRQIIGQCQQTFLVVDDSKFGKQAMTVINHLSEYSSVVTSYEFSKREEKKLQESGASLILI